MSILVREAGEICAVTLGERRIPVICGPHRNRVEDQARAGTDRGTCEKVLQILIVVVIQTPQRHTLAVALYFVSHTAILAVRFGTLVRIDRLHRTNAGPASRKSWM